MCKLPVLQSRAEVSVRLPPASQPALLTATCCLPHSTVCRRHHMQARLRRRLLNSWRVSKGPMLAAILLTMQVGGCLLAAACVFVFGTLATAGLVLPDCCISIRPRASGLLVLRKAQLLPWP